MNIKLVAWEPSRTRDFWWHPYDESLGKAMSASARLLYGRDADKPGALRRGLLPLLRVGRRYAARRVPPLRPGGYAPYVDRRYRRPTSVAPPKA